MDKQHFGQLKKVYIYNQLVLCADIVTAQEKQGLQHLETYHSYSLPIKYDSGLSQENFVNILEEVLRLYFFYQNILHIHKIIIEEFDYDFLQEFMKSVRVTITIKDLGSDDIYFPDMISLAKEYFNTNLSDDIRQTYKISQVETTCYFYFCNVLKDIRSKIKNSRFKIKGPVLIYIKLNLSFLLPFQ